MATNFSVNTAFKAQDKMSKVFKKMGKSSTVFGSLLKANLAGNAIMGGIRLLTNGLRTVGREFIEFEGALISSGAKFQDINTATAEGQRALKELGATAREVGATTKFSATEAAQGLDFLAMAGFTATEAMLALPAVTNLAVVAQTDLATATDMASDSLGAFGLEVTDLTRLNDVMAKTMTTSNTNMTDMFEAIKKGAPAFTAAGQDLETFNALLGTMANSGVKGSEAGTALRNVMLKLADPTAEAAKVMTKLGVITQDSKGDFLDVIDIIGQFETGLEGMGTAQRTAAISTVFGARTVTGMNLLLQAGSEELNKYRDSLKGAGGASAEMAGVIGGSLGNRIKSLKSALIETGFTFVSVFQEKAAGSLDRLTNIVRNIDLTSFALKIDEVINKIIDNLPIMKQKFDEMVPVVKEFASEMLIIVRSISAAVNKFNDFTGGTAFKAVATLFGGGYRAEAMQKTEDQKAQKEQFLSSSMSELNNALGIRSEAPNARVEEARAQTTTTNIQIMLDKELKARQDSSRSRGAPNVNIAQMGVN